MYFLITTASISRSLAITYFCVLTYRCFNRNTFIVCHDIFGSELKMLLTKHENVSMVIITIVFFSVRSNPITDSCIYVNLETLPSLLSTNWFMSGFKRDFTI